MQAGDETFTLLLRFADGPPGRGKHRPGRPIDLGPLGQGPRDAGSVRGPAGEEGPSTRPSSIATWRPAASPAGASPRRDGTRLAEPEFPGSGPGNFGARQVLDTSFRSRSGTDRIRWTRWPVPSADEVRPISSCRTSPWPPTTLSKARPEARGIDP